VGADALAGTGVIAGVGSTVTNGLGAVASTLAPAATAAAPVLATAGLGVAGGYLGYNVGGVIGGGIADLTGGDIEQGQKTGSTIGGWAGAGAGIGAGIGTIFGGIGAVPGALIGGGIGALIGGGISLMSSITDKRSGAGKNGAHGDGGRAQESAEKRIKELEEQLKNATTKKEKDRIKQTIKNIRQNAERKKKGENHSQNAKGS
jgi:hypothetical protein